MYSTATFPPFKVTDGAWGPCMLTLSESTGLSILAKDDTQVVLENSPWREVSHVTIKNLKKRIFQVKKYTGVKKCIKLSKRVDIERFEQTLKNSVGVKDYRNVLFQRKFTLIQPKVANSSPTYLQANPPMWNGVQPAGSIKASNENGSTPPTTTNINKIDCRQLDANSNFGRANNDPDSVWDILSTIVVALVLDNFRNKCFQFEIYNLA